MKITNEYIPIEEILSKLFWEVYYIPIQELLSDKFYNSKELLNSSKLLLEKISKGQIVYKDGKFTGKFTIQTSKELSKFAKYDSRSKCFRVKDLNLLPNDVRTMSVNANTKSERLHKELEKRIDSMSDEMKKRIKDLKLPLDWTADQIEKTLSAEYKSLGINYTPNESIRLKLIQQYNENMKLYIVNEDNPQLCWDTVQTQRLRDMVSKSAMDGYRKDKLIEMIQNEFETSKAKAKFLARQETSIFMSTLRETRFTDSGIKYYRWSTSHDNRVVGAPGGLYEPNPGHMNHYVMNGKYCKYDDPTVYCDSLDDLKNNKWKSRSNIGGELQHPGRAFLCRCVSIPLII